MNLKMAAIERIGYKISLNIPEQSVISMRKFHSYDLSQIGNADQTPLIF